MHGWVEFVAQGGAAIVEIIAIALLTGVSVYAIGRVFVLLARRARHEEIWSHTRETLGRGILFALELLVAADIMETVAVDLSYESLSVLAAIVLIRTFLSFTLEVELTGRWPWQSVSAESID